MFLYLKISFARENKNNQSLLTVKVGTGNHIIKFYK